MTAPSSDAHLDEIAECADALAHAYQLVEAANEELHEAVRAARRWGISWTVIAAVLDITRQSAQQRFGRVRIDLDDPDPPAPTPPAHNPPKRSRRKR